MRPLTIAPTRCSCVTARSSSAAEAAGSALGSAAKPEKRSGWAAIAAAIVSLNARDGNRAIGGRVLEAGLRRREDLDVDSGGVHVGDSARADVRQLRLECRRPAVTGK